MVKGAGGKQGNPQLGRKKHGKEGKKRAVVKTLRRSENNVKKTNTDISPGTRINLYAGSENKKNQAK